jgi:hypothetical protein
MGGVDMYLQAFLTLALEGNEWSASRPSRFTSGEKAIGTYWMGDWEGPIAGLDAVAKRKNPCPRPESNPGRPAHSPVTMNELPRQYDV